MSSPSNKIDDIKLRNVPTAAANTRFHITGAVNDIIKQNNSEDAEERFKFNTGELDNDEKIENIDLATYSVIHDATTNKSHNELNMRSTRKVNLFGGDLQSVDLIRSEAGSLEIEDNNEDVFFSDDDEIVVNFLGKSNHIARSVYFICFLFNEVCEYLRIFRMFCMKWCWLFIVFTRFKVREHEQKLFITYII